MIDPTPSAEEYRISCKADEKLTKQQLMSLFFVYLTSGAFSRYTIILLSFKLRMKTVTNPNIYFTVPKFSINKWLYNIGS